MHTENRNRTFFAFILLAVVTPRLVHGQADTWRRILSASTDEQATWIKAYLGRGMPAVEPDSSIITMLILNRSETTLPLIEQKVEEVLRSPSPAACFTVQSVDPQKFIDFAVGAIVGPGDLQSLKESTKLIRIDEKRFGSMIGAAMANSSAYRNPFGLAYLGLALDDPAVESGIRAFLRLQLRDRASPIPGAAEAETAQVRGWLAMAMVDRYGGVPTEEQWAADPIVLRLESLRTPQLHDDVMRAVAEALQKRGKK